jgi:uncharacterized tellurite resistance protein B-like protein
MKELRNELVESLAKVIIAAAWVDNELTRDEINCLKDVLYRYYSIFNLGQEVLPIQWAQFEMYLEQPVGAAERGRLAEELRRNIKTREEQEVVFLVLNQVVEADGKVTADEQKVIDEIKLLVEEDNDGFVHKVGALINGALNRRSTAMAQAPNREQFFEEFLSNKVYYDVRLRLGVDDDALRIDDVALRRLSAAGGLMAKVALVDRELAAEESDAMKDALETNWEINPYEASFVVEVALAEVTAELDYTRLTREFVTFTSVTERARFLDILFAVADADGFVSLEEIREIHNIATHLLLSSQSVEEAQKRIPAERRAN